MEPSDLKVGRYLYWQGSVQHTFEIVKQESQSQLILAQVVDGVASSGVLKRTKDSEWETSVSTEIQWQLQAAGDAVLVQRSDGCSFRAERMMESQEWQEIVSKPVDAGQTLLITAAPGSGKSTLLREWCRGRPDNKILLLAFNKAVVDQLEANFSELPNVTVKTIHSVAYFATSHLHHGKVGDPTKTDLKNFLDCDWSEVDRQQELLRSFCASAATRLPTSKRQKSLWMHLASGKSGWRVPHNAYLKLLHLSPELRDQAFRGYEIVALDEAQDCTDCMLDILSGGTFARVMACDPHQNIYQFNKVDGSYLANMKVDYRMCLPQSFRFGKDIAQLLTQISKQSPLTAGSTEVKGMPNLTTSYEIVETPTKAIKKLLGEKQKMTVLGRKNSTIFSEAMHLISTLDDGKSISFIGGFEAFKEKQLLPVLDLFYLRQGRKEEMISNYPKSFPSLDRFRSKCEQQEDVEWLTKFKIYDELRKKKMGPEGLQVLIDDIEDKCNMEASQADVVFSTVHQAKGLGFHNVVLLDDFLDDYTVEEYNIFYVACSRVSTGSLSVAMNTMKSLESRCGRKRRCSQDTWDYFDDFDGFYGFEGIEDMFEGSEDMFEAGEDMFEDMFEGAEDMFEATEEDEENEECEADDC